MYKDIVLRTQTSPVQARVMEQGQVADPYDRTGKSIPF